MSRCSRCGKLNEPEAYFCQDCGTRLATDPHVTESIELAKCQVCGKANPKDTRFCHVCGVRLEDSVSRPGRARRAEIECPVCGKDTPSGFAFCQYCGNRIEGEDARLSDEAVPPTPPAGVKVMTPGRAGPSTASGTVGGQAGRDRPDAVAARAAVSPGQTAELTGLSLTVRKMAGSAGEAPSAVSKGQASGPAAQAQAAGTAPYAQVESGGEQRVRPAAAAAAGEVLAWLTSIKKDHTEGVRHEVRSFPFDIGRTEGPLTFAEDRFLSDRHCRVVRTAGGHEIQDLGSVNGVYLKISEPVPIEDGQTFLLGAQLLRFERLLPEEREPAPAVENGVVLFGTPPGRPWGRLRLLTSTGIGRDVYHLHLERVVLGRVFGEVTFGHDPLVSEKHAALSRRAAGAELEDLSSSNGTFMCVRGRRDLKSGDTIRVGDQLLRFDPAGTSGPRGSE